MLDGFYDNCVLSAADVLPPFYRDALMDLGAGTLSEISELRLRAGRFFSALRAECEFLIYGRDGKRIKVTRDDILAVLDRATQSSIHSYSNSIKNGYVTVEGGHRIGICGSVVMKDGIITGIKDFSSLNIRIAKEIKGISEELITAICAGEGFRGVLVVSPPGGGKTTLLRDMIRMFSKQFRVAVADERSELAGAYQGMSQFDLGGQTDVLDACPKGIGVMMLLRSMNPEIIAVDEITAKDDADALMSAHNCGVKLLATAHADKTDDIKGKKIYRMLLDAGAFSDIVFIKKQPDGRRYYEHLRLKEGNYA